MSLTFHRLVPFFAPDSLCLWLSLATSRHLRRVRYLGLARNQLELTLKAVAYNLKRLVRIIERQSA